MSWSRHDHPAEVGNAWADAQTAYDVLRRTQNTQAARVVAAQATDVDDCTELLAMLGLDAQGSRPV
jgi:hypothetical protein